MEGAVMRGCANVTQSLGDIKHLRFHQIRKRLFASHQMDKNGLPLMMR